MTRFTPEDYETRVKKAEQFYARLQEPSATLERDIAMDRQAARDARALQGFRETLERVRVMANAMTLFGESFEDHIEKLHNAAKIEALCAAELDRRLTEGQPWP